LWPQGKRRLADRMEEMPLLERHFVARFAAEYGKEIRGLTHRARCRLAQHSWPGNVREFERAGPCGHDGEQRQDRRNRIFRRICGPRLERPVPAQSPHPRYEPGFRDGRVM
jgi:transcriptional regulator with GAF, ATPase, and Fis domain